MSIYSNIKQLSLLSPEDLKVSFVLYIMNVVGVRCGNYYVTVNLHVIFA